MKKFEIVRRIFNENGFNTGICEVIPQKVDLGKVIEYKSEHGVFYTSIDRLNSYKRSGRIKVIE